MAVSWSHCVLRVRDLDAMVSFYCDALGFQVADRGMLGPDAEIVFLTGSSSDHHQMGLTTGRSDDDGDQSLAHNAFRVDTVADVKRMVAWVAEDDRAGRGAPVTHGNAISVYFTDPEGNGIEIFCDTPWHVQQPQIGRWDPTMSDEEILAKVEADFGDTPEFKPMEQYRAERAAAFGET